MFCPEDPYVKYLQARIGARVYLKPYWGNSGDDLIWMGNQALLKELGLIQVTDPRKADIILWPGGNPTMWASNLEGWQDCWRRWPDKTFVVAPATFQDGGSDWRTLLRNAPGNVAAAFARDPVSHRHLTDAGLRLGIQIGLGHDPALHLKDGEWTNAHREACTSEYVLASFRGDHESALRSGPGHRFWQIWPLSLVSSRLDIRRRIQFHHKWLKTVRKLAGSDGPILDRDASTMSFESFVECVQRASQVHTDRLHCLILAVLLGKEVFAYPTAYAKLEAVYAHSIKSWARVSFVEG